MTKGNSFRLFGACLLLSFGAHACGGTVVDRTSPRERLTRDGTTNCKAACTAITACPSTACDCGCGCPVDAPNCCDACTCHQPTVQECLKSCGEVLDEEISKAGCEAELLGVLDCAASGDCSPNHCVPVARAYEDCREGKSTNGTGSDGEPPSARPTVGPCTVVSSSLGSQFEPGEIACDTKFADCSDGHEYQFTCRGLDGTNVSCECFIDGMSVATFVTNSCDVASVQMAELCGWSAG